MDFKIGLILIMFCAAPFLYGQENSESTNAHKSLYVTKIDLTKGTEGTEDWAEKIASVVFDETISEDEKTYEFYVSKQENDLLVNQEMPLKSDKVNKEESSNNCETVKKTCRSEKCIANTLIEILGDGDRDVLIKYERKLLAVQIYFTYQDCQ